LAALKPEKKSKAIIPLCKACKQHFGIYEQRLRKLYVADTRCHNERTKQKNEKQDTIHIA
jgi:hypothetical protein